MLINQMAVISIILILHILSFNQRKTTAIEKCRNDGERDVKEMLS